MFAIEYYDFLKRFNHIARFELEMLLKKLQMLAYSFVSLKHNFSWLKQWNESSVLRKAKNFPKQGFSNI